MKTQRKSKFDLKAARASLKIMQSVFAESKQLKQITKEVKYHISYVSKTMKRLKKSGLITRDSITKLYYVPVKSLVREYAEESGVFEDEEIDTLIQLINMKRDEISKADFNKKLLKKARHIRVYPSILFLSLLNLADFDPKDKRYGYYFKFTLTLQGIAGREYIKQFFTTIFD